MPLYHVTVLQTGHHTKFSCINNRYCSSSKGAPPPTVTWWSMNFISHMEVSGSIPARGAPLIQAVEISAWFHQELGEERQPGVGANHITL